MVWNKSCLLVAQGGSKRYGYADGGSDIDLLVLTESDLYYTSDEAALTDYFFTSVENLSRRWGDPLLLGNLTGDCTGNERLCTFLREHRHDITYAAPACTALFGLDYIAVGERYGHLSPIRAGLRTAMVLSHMAEEVEDPFFLSEEEKAVLIRAKTGGVTVGERADIYRRTISPENIHRLMRMPDHPTIKKELFQLIEEVSR